MIINDFERALRSEILLAFPAGGSTARRAGPLTCRLASGALIAAEAPGSEDVPELRSAALHLPKPTYERFRNRQLFATTFQLDDQASAHVRFNAGNLQSIDDGGTVGLPELLGIEFG